MIPLLPEMPVLPMMPAGTGALPLPPSGEVGGLDFAGLLGAAMPQPQPQPQPLPPMNGAAIVTITPGSLIPEDAAMPAADVPVLAAAPLLPERAAPSAPLLATGRNLPLPGAELPEPVAPTPTSALAPDTLAALAPPPVVLPRNLTGAGDPAPAAAEVPAEPTPPTKPARILASEAAAREPLTPTEEVIAEPLVAECVEEEAAPPASDTPEHDGEQPDVALAIAIAPPLQPVPQPAATPAAKSDAIVAVTPKRPIAPRIAVALPGPADATLPSAEAPAQPVRPATAAVSAEPEPASPAPLPASSVSPPAPAATPGDVAAPPAADPASPTAATPPPVPAALAALAPAPNPTPTPERTDLRADTPAPQQQSTIDQVGDLREALRSARPAMTLHHAEFGAVSLRLEATGVEGWRAVLASRDPGFVPAIQTALAERAVMSAAASPDSGGFMHHSGTGEHRSGSTPNGGQGASQPYLGQSGSRDGEAAPDHRRPSTAAALAARAEAEEAGSGSPGQGSGGLFA